MKKANAVNVALCGVIVDQQVAFLSVPFEFAPVARQITDGFTQGVLSGDLWLCLFDPAFQLSKYWQAVFLTPSFTVSVTTRPAAAEMRPPISRPPNSESATGMM